MTTGVIYWNRITSVITIRTLTRGSSVDVSNVRRIFTAAPSYSQIVEGRPPSDADVDAFFDGLPPGKNASDKFSFGLFLGTDMIGCADVIRAYPTDDRAFIGLLLLSESHQGRGYGKACFTLLTRLARDWNCEAIRLGVVSTNSRALAFWQREGFEVVERKENPRFTGDIAVMERSCRGPGSGDTRRECDPARAVRLDLGPSPRTETKELS